MESGLATLPIPGHTCGEARSTGASGFNLLLLQCRLLRQIGHPMESKLPFLEENQADPGRSMRFRRKTAAPNSYHPGSATKRTQTGPQTEVQLRSMIWSRLSASMSLNYRLDRYQHCSAQRGS